MIMIRYTKGFLKYHIIVSQNVAKSLLKEKNEKNI